MKNIRMFQTLRTSVALLFTILILQGCIAGTVRDTAGNAIENVDVVAIGNCTGDGCAANETPIVIGNDLETGYHQPTNDKGQYFFDPYGEMVAPEDAMAVSAPEGSTTVRFSYSKDGYQQVVLTHEPQYENHVHPDTGKTYVIAGAPDIYLCRDDEVDTDGDTICDDAEKQYGTSHGNVDTDNDGVNDNVELFN